MRFLRKIISFGLKEHKKICAVLSVIGGTYVIYSSERVDHVFNLVKGQSRFQENVPTYIPCPETMKGLQPADVNDPRDVSFVMSFCRNQKLLYLMLLELTGSPNLFIRHKAVNALTKMFNLDDSQYCMIAQSCDLKTAVGMARTAGASPKLFLSPPSRLLVDNKRTIGTYFQHILQSLPIDESHECIDYLTRFALKYLSSTEVDHHMPHAVSEVDGNVYNYRQRKHMSSSKIMNYLNALLAHSTIPYHRQLMVERGVLVLLHQVEKKFQSNEVRSLISQIIGNIVLDKELHQSIYASGWIGKLSTWMRSSDIAVNLPAARALVNMDVDYDETTVFGDGLYLLHPHFRNGNAQIEADVVFVHGLMGGAFRTWRQHDRMNIKSLKEEGKNSNSNNYASNSEPGTNYTFCWPKDWLAKEFPNLRLIAVHYSSHASEWKSKCPIEKEKRDIKTRSEDTLKKLIEAGIGKRPIIWVSHSMGGLLVKQMLLDSATSTDASRRSVVKKTIGTVFYSVPHRGADPAGMGKSALMLLQPSIEAQQMKKDSPKLLKMHEEFKNLVNLHNIQVLSFGEVVETQWGLNWKAILVPSSSANPDVGYFHELPVSHLNTCKPESKTSESYALLVQYLVSVLKSHKKKSTESACDEFMKRYLSFGNMD